MTPYVDDTDFTLYVGDVRDVLATLPDESVHCVVTSPPYWGLRDYGTGLWDGGDQDCDHINAPGAATGNKGAVTTVPMRASCSKCGARRTDKQLGLEPTPDEYVANMVAVFREVKRVLRRDGTCWLNIGDSYASNGTEKSSGNASESRATGMHGSFKVTQSSLRDRAYEGVPNQRPVGLKPKDLVGIPWRLAFALQQPYYTGTIADERDRIWLAAMIDAEGCVFIHKRKVGQSNGQGYERKNDTYGAGMEISNTSREIVERVMAIVGKGSISTSTRGRNQPLYRWNLRTNECRDVLREVYPHLVSKQHQARLAIGCPSSGKDAEAAHISLIALHNGDAATIDFAPPETLFEPGWYVRSDIVWSKANPMPESVTDRPTKAHEYLFLLTRSPRYFYDADAIREPAEYGRGTDPSGRMWDRVGNGSKAAEHKPGGKGHTFEGGRNRRSVWEIATEPYPDAHFATFPQALVEPCILAGTSERGCCPVCGAPWERETEVVSEIQTRPGSPVKTDDSRNDLVNRSKRIVRTSGTTGWRPTCDNDYDSNPPVPCVVLDPFMGSGTTAIVARRLGRKSIGIELNAEYAQLAARRLQQLSLLA